MQPGLVAARFRSVYCWAAVVIGVLGNLAWAEELSYPLLVIEDAKRVLSSPARWEHDDWRNAGWAALAVGSTAALIDRPLRDEMRRHAPNDNRFLLEAERFGAEYSLAVLGAFYLDGIAGQDERAAAVAQDGLAASLIASGIVTPAIKFATGRARPRENAGAASFRPFDGSYALNSSFPSGHTTQAFAVASVVSSHYQAPWVGYAAYSLAGLVGMARAYHDAHFASDVLAGALVGTLVGRSVVAHNEYQRSGKFAVLPLLAPGMAGFQLVRSL